jgi:hypothetical protein
VRIFKPGDQFHKQMGFCSNFEANGEKSNVINLTFFGLIRQSKKE